jgi:hypothetical protein
MLNDELRVNSGLTYGASSRFNALKMEVHLQSARSQPKKLPSQLSIKPWKSLISCIKWYRWKIIGFKKLCQRTVSTIRNYRTTSQLADTNVLVWFWQIFYKQFWKNVDDLDLAKAKSLLNIFLQTPSICFGRKSRWNQKHCEKNMVKWSKWNKGWPKERTLITRTIN